MEQLAHRMEQYELRRHCGHRMRTGAKHGSVDTFSHQDEVVAVHQGVGVLCSEQVMQL